MGLKRTLDEGTAEWWMAPILVVLAWVFLTLVAVAIWGMSNIDGGGQLWSVVSIVWLVFMLVASMIGAAVAFALAFITLVSWLFDAD